MSATPTTMGSAERWGRIWGARAEDWAETEERQLATYEEAIRQIGLEAGQRVLEVGCGSGVFLRLAADLGAAVTGLDASEALLRLAAERVPEADLHLGDMQFMPFEDDRFDLVASFNSFFFADDMVAALREAGRVARPGAPVIVQVWGRPERCSLETMKVAVAPFQTGGARTPPDFWKPGVLEAMATEAGLTPERAFDASWAYDYADDDALLRGMLSAGGLGFLADQVGGGRVEAAILEALAPVRRPEGGYALENEWRYIIAAA